MGLETKYILKCDRCGTRADFLEVEKLNPDELQKEAKNHGWDIRDNSSLCPSCFNTKTYLGNKSRLESYFSNFRPDVTYKLKGITILSVYEELMEAATTYECESFINNAKQVIDTLEKLRKDLEEAKNG